MTKKNELEEQIEKVDAAISMLEGQMKQPKSTKNKVKEFLCRFVPASKRNGLIIDEQLQELSYSILVVQKQFLTFVNAVNKNPKQGNKFNDKGHGQYQ